MADSTYKKIQQVLSDLIDRYGRVFWYDEGGQMQLFATSLDIPDVEVLTLGHYALRQYLAERAIPASSQNVALSSTAQKRNLPTKTTGSSTYRCQLLHSQQTWGRCMLPSVAYLWN